MINLVDGSVHISSLFTLTAVYLSARQILLSMCRISFIIWTFWAFIWHSRLCSFVPMLFFCVCVYWILKSIILVTLLLCYSLSVCKKSYKTNHFAWKLVDQEAIFGTVCNDSCKEENWKHTCYIHFQWWWWWIYEKWVSGWLGIEYEVGIYWKWLYAQISIRIYWIEERCCGHFKQ